MACSTTGEASIASPPSAATVASTNAPTSTTMIRPRPVEVDKGDLDTWEIITISVGGEELVVAVADDPGERAQGLKGVDDLRDLDGMLFVYPEEGTSGFWMKDTLIPLDIAFFDDDGALVDALTMEPCPADPCPSYGSSGPFTWALETPVGRLGQMASGTTLSVGG